MKEVKLTPKKREALEELGISSSLDILEYYPYRYETVTFLPFSQWQLNSKVVVEGTVTSRPRLYRFGRNKSVISFELTTSENTFRISVFNQIWYLKLEVGTRLVVVGRYEGQSKILASQITTDRLEEVVGIKPVYSLKDKVKPRYFSQLVEKVLEDNRDEIPDFIPEAFRNKHHLISKYSALKEVHFPQEATMLQQALRTLKYEEFLRFQCFMLQRKQAAHVHDERSAKQFDENKLHEFIEKLPFELTSDQKKSVTEITADMKSGFQMCRLLQGDVGSGKTVVAFTAMYAAVLAGCQAALMAPTEILAKQHYDNICRIFAGYDVRCALLYSGLQASQRQKLLQELADGTIDMVVGTHALFQEDVNYLNLGLIVTDEQHRFGVRQRQMLQKKGVSPDILLMSATPIPRTLATSLYGDMDVSTITETPNRGKVIHTRLIKQNSFIPVIDEIEDLLSKGNQMYVICAAIEKNSEVTVRNVNDIYTNLSTYFKGRYNVGLLHGQMSEEERDAVQKAFREHQIDILVATTVVEVGVDVHSANIMVIYDANRFGLSQLHQLRGRIGRGSAEGYCYLLTATDDEEALQRLQVIERNTDGFKISYEDLKLRGPGDILGYRQSGLPVFRVGNVIEDAAILNEAREDAKTILENIDLEEYRAVREYLEKANNDDTIYLD